jgi:WD40 repeat protein
MGEFSNQNILKLIFSCFRLYYLKRKIITINNTIITYISLRLLKCHDRFKSMGLANTLIEEAHDDYIYSLASIDERYYITASSDSTLKVWDINTNICLQTLKGHGSSVNYVITLSNNQIASCSSFLIKLWNTLENFKCIKTIQFEHYNCFSGFYCY